MKKFFENVGRFLKKNYWIEPLLLVIVVFAIVFSLEGASNVWDTVKSWFSPNYICKQCKRVNVDVSNEAIEGISGKEGEKVYVYYYEKATTENSVADCNEVLNEYLKAYNKGKEKEDKIVVYGVKYGVKETGDVNTDVIEKWYDKKMTEEKYDKIADDVNAWLETIDQEVSYDNTAPYTSYNTSVILTPTLVCYVGTADGYEVEYALRGTSDIDSLDTMKNFFLGRYDKID